MCLGNLTNIVILMWLNGDVISPILFNIHIDELLLLLEKLGIGCYIGTMFVGAIGYADDLTLLIS